MFLDDNKVILEINKNCATYFKRTLKREDSIK